MAVGDLLLEDTHSAVVTSSVPLLQFPCAATRGQIMGICSAAVGYTPDLELKGKSIIN